MTAVAARTFGIIGPLAAFPQRLAAREVERQGGTLRRGVSRRTSHVVVGRRLLGKAGEEAIETRIEAVRDAGKTLLSEKGFLRQLGLVAGSDSAAMTRGSLLDQSGLAERDFGFLELFDAFEHDIEPYSFRDLILARKYAGLIHGGATWGAIARSVHRSPGPVASLTALSLHADRQDAIYARQGDTVSELDGQMLLPLEDRGDDGLEEFFALAEEAEEDERFEVAASLYQRCLTLDPLDPTAAFNRANCLRAAGRSKEAKIAYLRTIKLDPDFVEAWFNFAGMLKDQGEPEAARRNLARAIRLDPDYADAIYNLAAIEFEENNLEEARRWWIRYLELDKMSEWARNAQRGIHYADLSLAQRGAS